MKVTLQKINNEKVKPIKRINPLDPRPVKGADLFDNMTGNIFMDAKTNSGKTCNVGHIVKKTADKNTTIIAFCSTVYDDDSWLGIRQYCEKHDIPFIGHQSMFNDEGENELVLLLQQLKAEAKAREEAAIREKQEVGGATRTSSTSGGTGKKKEFSIILCDESSDEEEEEPERKSKYKTPKYIIIFDDLADEIKSKYLTQLLKKSRHYNMKVIVSSQYYLDVEKAGRKQFFYYLIYGGAPKETLDKIRTDSGAPIDKELFELLYEDATEQPYSFLYISRKGEFRKNYDEKYNLRKK